MYYKVFCCGNTGILCESCGKTMNTKRKSVAYVRVSSKEQEREGFSIQAQKRLLREYAKKNDISIQKMFTDVETAKRTGRPSFKQMLEFLKDNPDCGIVLVEKTDRLYRNFRDCVTLDDLKVELHFVKENSIISENSRSHEKLVQGFLVLMAKNFSDNLSEETSKGMREKGRQGLWPSYAPVGYVNTVSPSEKKIIAPDPDRAPIIAKLFDVYSKGDTSLKELAKKARMLGLTRRGKGTFFTPASFHRLLKNRIYYGEFTWKGMVFKGSHKPIITRSLWQRVQEVTDDRRRGKTRRVKHDFAFSKLIKCGHCGCAMVGEVKKGKYIYYHCTGYKGKCKEPYTREEKVDVQFRELLESLNFDQEVMDFIKEHLMQTVKEKKTFREETLKRLNEELDKLHTRMDMMYEDRLDCKITSDFFEHKAGELMKKMDEISASISTIEAEDTDSLNAGVDILELAQTALQTYSEYEPSERRKLLRILLSNCSWIDGTLQADFRQPFNMLADTNAVWKEKKATGGEGISISEIWYP
jgi:DNA invertase Pin-like site-specific DNA recombinase